MHKSQLHSKVFKYSSFTCDLGDVHVSDVLTQHVIKTAGALSPPIEELHEGEHSNIPDELKIILISRYMGGAGVNHVKRDWHEIVNVNCDLYLFFCVKRDWGYLHET